MRVVLALLAAYCLFAQAMSEWAFPGPDHRLHYRYDARLNRIMDFSAAGYRGGGVKLPSAAAAQRLTPVGGDNTERIQAMLDSAAGAVVLASGEYEIAGTLRITRSGVVLRGEKGAVIRLTGTPHHFLEIRGAGTWREEGTPAPVLDAYVPAGAIRFQVRGASSFHSGDRVLVLRPVTAEWAQFVGMESKFAGSVIRTDRVVDSAQGDYVTLDVPLSDPLDSRYTAASLVHYSFPERITEVGVEGLRIEAQSGDAILMDAVEDGWVRDLDIRDTQKAIAIGASTKRVTVTNVRVTHATASAGADFAVQGTQILLDRCRVTGEGTTPVVTEADAVGPNVVLNFTADHGGVAPRDWTTGLLVDGGKFPGGTERRPGVAFSNCGTVGWAVAWNVSSPFFLVQQPAGALNWCIGCMGTAVTAGEMPNGIFDATGKTVEPVSLYLQQLQDRIGPEALRNIGY